jgi:hypothetical protein
MKVDMSAEAGTARIKRTCELSNFARALILARSAAARARLERLDIKKYPQPKAESSKQERE